jgi:hypothetical protein
MPLFISDQKYDDCFVDLLAFAEAAAHERWQEAVDLYRRPFTEGFSMLFGG